MKFVAHTRFGLLERAKAILTSADISNPVEQNILILKELVKNKDFGTARNIYLSIENSDFLNENFTVLSKDLQMLLYPRPYESEINLALNQLETNNMDKYLVYAIIRGESMYIPLARSRAGARGLMQLMPATARLVSPKVREKRNINLYNPVNNIMLGTTFLNDSIESYGLLTAIASYNGGIRVINLTKQRFYPESDLELMELVPYAETREYIKKVFSNYYRYKNIYEREEWNAKLSQEEKKKA